MGSRILWAIVLGFLAGVFVRSFFPIGIVYAEGAALIAVAALTISSIDRAYARHAIVFSVGLIAAGAGIMRMDMSIIHPDPMLDRSIDKKVILEGVVTGEPDVRETGVLVSIKIRALIVGSSTIPVHVGVLAHAPLYEEVSYGDRVRVTGTLKEPRPFDSGPASAPPSSKTTDGRSKAAAGAVGREFNYPMYLAKDGISYELSYAHIDVEGNEGNVIKKAAIWTKQMYEEGLRAALAEPEAGLAGGITVGDKRSMGPELTEAFRRASLVHMVVLSGYNITVVMNFIRWCLQLLPHYMQYGGIFSAILFFVLMSGGAASAVRAGAMALIAVFARATARTFFATRVLGVVALVMVLWNPYILGFDPSFQLSALATLGLIMFTPLFSARLAWLTEKFALREIVASTLGTQLAVLPLLLYQNGQLSLVALPANVLALAPIPLAMLFSFIASVAGIFFGPFAIIVGFPAYALLFYIITVAKLFAALPFAAVSIPAFSAWLLLPSYAALGVGAICLHKNIKNEKPRCRHPSADGGGAGFF